MRDYRTYLRSVGRRSVAGLKLRTEKKPGDVEIVHVGGGDYELFRHGEEDGRPPPSEGQAASASHPSRNLRCVSAKGGILDAEDIAA